MTILAIQSAISAYTFLPLMYRFMVHMYATKDRYVAIYICMLVFKVLYVTSQLCSRLVLVCSHKFLYLMAIIFRKNLLKAWMKGKSAEQLATTEFCMHIFKQQLIFTRL